MSQYTIQGQYQSQHSLSEFMLRDEVESALVSVYRDGLPIFHRTGSHCTRQMSFRTQPLFIREDLLDLLRKEQEREAKGEPQRMWFCRAGDGCMLQLVPGEQP